MFSNGRMAGKLDFLFRKLKINELKKSYLPQSFADDFFIRDN